MTALSDANDTDLGYILYDAFDLDIPGNWKPGKVEKPETSQHLFPSPSRKRHRQCARLARHQG